MLRDPTRASLVCVSWRRLRAIHGQWPTAHIRRRKIYRQLDDQLDRRRPL